MKTGCSILFVAVALIGCAESEVVDIARTEQIGFETSVAKTTKGMPVTEFHPGATLSVWGYTSSEPLTAATVAAGIPADAAGISALTPGTVTLGSDGVWDYAPKGYWSTQTYHSFVAVAPATANAVYSGGVVSYSNPVDIAAQVDFMVAEACYATAPYTRGTGAPVSFRFRHALTLVRFGAVVVEAAGKRDICVTGVKLLPSTGFAAAGTVNIAAQGPSPVQWASLGSMTTPAYLLTPAQPVAVPTDRDAGSYTAIDHAAGQQLMLIPQSAGIVSFEVMFSYTDTDGSKTATARFETSTAQVWTANAVFAYNFRIDVARALDMKVVTFAPSVSDWDDLGGEGELLAGARH